MKKGFTAEIFYPGAFVFIIYWDRVRTAKVDSVNIIIAGNVEYKNYMLEIEDPETGEVSKKMFPGETVFESKEDLINYIMS